MPVWRCPHCATPQTEAARCWVCRRSTTSCVTCRHYRRGISGGIGVCGLDPGRNPVAATDVHACWVDAARVADDLGIAPAPGPEAASLAVTGAGSASPGGRVPRTFVPIESVAPRRDGGAVAVLEPSTEAAPADDPAPATDRSRASVANAVMTPATSPRRTIPGRWWLWGDPDPWPERLGERWA